jgi:hypothetical protein
MALFKRFLFKVFTNAYHPLAPRNHKWRVHWFGRMFGPNAHPKSKRKTLDILLVTYTCFYDEVNRLQEQQAEVNETKWL